MKMSANTTMIDRASVKASWQVHDPRLSKQLESLRQHRVFCLLRSGYPPVCKDAA
jgi:hypothetical protein